MKVYLHPVSLSNFDMLYIVIFCYFHSSNGITGRKKIIKTLNIFYSSAHCFCTIKHELVKRLVNKIELFVNAITLSLPSSRMPDSFSGPALGGLVGWVQESATIFLTLL